ncbi:hypothetical protein C2857_006136 [Epichloe festucae Fl1]|uniref:F-box domain-containing protein n=1 Tax=Epichloe festucae (strain Fl1) TaxID=877507 RepID=A0A7S9PSL4_EPIFF|nr:hypothetical protein C2857_006136 [Epichloe festucae Fl1]
MAHASLTGLPDDLLLDIIEYLDTSRDVCRLGQATRRTQRLVEQDGWRAFVKTRFPSFREPGAQDVSWSWVADQYTYLDRCWNKRAVQFSLFRTLPPPRQRNRNRNGGGPPGQAVDFHGVVDARYVSGLDQEVVAWGAGEDIQVRWAARVGSSSKGKDGAASAGAGSWGSILGREGGYSAGTGDVTALKMMESPAAGGDDGDGGVRRPQVVVGRANGDVEVLSVANDSSFGKPMRSVVKLDARADSSDGRQLPAPMSISPGRLAVSCTEWQPDTDMLAASRSSLLHLYKMAPEEEDAELAELEPLSFNDMSAGRPPNQGSLVRDIKFLDRDHVAVALGRSSQPIQYGTVRPTGVVFEPAAHNPDVYARKQGRLQPPLSALTDVNTIVWAIEPVGHKNSKNLLLSSWQDGTFRLLDARTPSPHDAIYRDNFQPYQAGGPLLVYGTERFVTGNNTAPTVRFFDFRFDKPYFHSAASECSSAQPQPRVCCSSGTTNLPKLGRSGNDIASESECKPGRPGRCPWHALSRTDCYRQDATLWLGYRGMDRVFSLARASDTSDKFYLGLRGAVAEAQLVLKEDVPSRRETRNPSCPDGWRVSSVSSVTVAETGVGLCTSRVHDGLHGELHSGMPALFYNKDTADEANTENGLADPPQRSRLDTALRQQLPMRRRGNRFGHGQ